MPALRDLARLIGLPRRELPEPRHVVITGASSGIGRALAEAYARPGRLLSLGGRSAERLEACAEACRARGASVETHCCDVTDFATLEVWLGECDRREPVDLLIANAGVGGAGAMAADCGEEPGAARQILSVNALGVVSTVSALLPRFVERRAGHVAVMGSLAGFLGLPDCPAYSASKAAVHAYAEALRRLVRPAGVYVTVIAPGFVETPMGAGLTLPRPWLWSAERAAEHIAAGLSRRARTIVFPWQLRAAITAGKLLPTAVLDEVLTRARTRTRAGAA